MHLFWDTSALLASVLLEQHSDAAQVAWESSDLDYAWSWLKAEAHSALSQRGATPSQWTHLQQKLDAMRFLDIPHSQLDSLCERCRKWRLRAADAGHLYCCEQAVLVMPDLQFFTLDEEQLEAARKNRFALWTPGSPPAPAARARKPASRGPKAIRGGN